MDEIVNKVAQSNLITFDLEELYPVEERVLFDLKDYLWQGIALKEKEYRQALKEHSWEQYKNKFVALHCSEDAIIPSWAYMLAAIYLQPLAKKVVFGDLLQLERELFSEMISKLDPAKYRDQRVVIKGCSKLPVPESAYVEATNFLRPLAKSIMFGEPCSTVPIYKQK